MHKNQRKIILALWIVILLSSYATASSSAMPAAAFAKSHLDATQPPIAPPISSDAPAAIVLATQPLGSLAVIAWNNLDAPIYPSVFSQLLILPANDELMGQSGASGQPADTSTNAPIAEDPLPQGSDPAHTLVVFMDTHRDVGLSCTTCHSVPDTMYPLITKINYQQSIEQQYHPGSLVDCAICHIKKHQQISWQFRGAQ